MPFGKAADDDAVYGREWFGPISFVVATDSTDDVSSSIAALASTAPTISAPPSVACLSERGSAVNL